MKQIYRVAKRWVDIHNYYHDHHVIYTESIDMAERIRNTLALDDDSAHYTIIESVLIVEPSEAINYRFTFRLVNGNVEDLNARVSDGDKEVKVDQLGDDVVYISLVAQSNDEAFTMMRKKYNEIKKENEND